MPRYEYSFHLGGAWKGIDLDLYFQGVGKREDWTTSSLNLPAMVHADVAIYSHQTSYNKVLWNSDYTAITGYEVNQGNRYPRLYRGTNNSGGTVSGIANGCNNYYPQSRYLTDMSYLRLKNVTVGYTFRKSGHAKPTLRKHVSTSVAATSFCSTKGITFQSTPKSVQAMDLQPVDGDV